MIFQLFQSWSDDYIGTYSFEDEEIDEQKIYDLYKEFTESSMKNSSAQFDDFIEKFHPEIKMESVIISNIYV